jgi:hypothetical protein
VVDVLEVGVPDGDVVPLPQRAELLAVRGEVFDSLVISSSSPRRE